MSHRRLTGRLVVATHNPGKLIEMKMLLEPHGVEAVSAAELGLTEPEETEDTFEGNARLKAEAAAKAAQLPAFADDSGLVIDALGGTPGIHTARWAGPDRDFEMAMEKVEEELRKVGASAPEQRKARFVSALCIAWPDGHLEEFQGVVEGTLVWPPRGAKGFGYDPMFRPEDYEKTFAEMTADEKHAMPPKGFGLSHRARAFLKLSKACLEG